MLGSADSMRAMLSMYKAVTLLQSLQQHAEGKDVPDEEQGRKEDAAANHFRRWNVLCFDVFKLKPQVSPAAERPVYSVEQDSAILLNPTL